MTDALSNKLSNKQSSPFPKPSPADTPPFAKWMANQEDRAEVGREPFFEGRDDEFAAFRKAGGKLAEGLVGGGSLVFQGAPGAGKTALMNELIEVVRLRSARNDIWLAVQVDPGDLARAGDLVGQIVEEARREKERLNLGEDAKLLARMFQGIAPLTKPVADLGKKALNRGLQVLGVGFGPKQPTNGSPASLFNKTADALGNARVFLFVDEAQNIPSGDQEARNILDKLHRGRTGIALTPVFLGLSDTVHHLVECGISRASLSNIRELTPMSPEDAKAVFLRLLNEYNLGPAGPTRDAWAEKLAKESQGWPQHIRGFSVAVGRAITSNSGLLDDNAIEQALVEGRKIKAEYYDARLGTAVSDPGLYKRIALTMVEKQTDSLSMDDIGLLAEATLAKLNMSLTDFLSRSLHAGILSPASPAQTSFRIPIPSLAKYLREKPDVRPTPKPPEHNPADDGALTP